MLATLPDLMRLSLSDPNEAASRLLQHKLNRNTLWLAMALIVVLSVILQQLSSFLIPVSPDKVLLPILQSPFLAVLVIWGVMVLMVFCIYYIGRSFGGLGHFDGALSIVIWLQAIMVVIQLAQLVLLLTVPPLAVLLGLVGGVLFLWLLVNFIAALHGFKSLGLVLVGIVASMVGVAFGLSLIGAIFAVAIGIEVPNV
jgi:hypothetical protein